MWGEIEEIDDGIEYVFHATVVVIMLYNGLSRNDGRRPERWCRFVVVVE